MPDFRQIIDFWGMQTTNRSLWIAVLACVAMGFFARKPQYAGLGGAITLIFFGATIALSIYGIVLGVRGYRQQRTAWSSLAPFINGLILGAFLAFCWLLWTRVLHEQ